MGDDQGLDPGEHIVVEGLEQSPVALWELGWPEASSRQRVAEVARGFVEVRHFESWPEPWEHGRPVVGDELLAESRRVERWSDSAARTHLVVQITTAGASHL